MRRDNAPNLVRKRKAMRIVSLSDALLIDASFVNDLAGLTPEFREIYQNKIKQSATANTGPLESFPAVHVRAV